MPMATVEARRDYQRRWVANRRAEYFLGKKCVKCDSTENLELDHIDPSTKDPLLRQGTRLWGWSLARREAEVAKCQILCHTCHVEKTTSQSYPTHGKHGTTGMYRRGCRCRSCKLAKSVEKMNWRSATGRR